MMFVRGRLVDVDLGDLDRWCRAHLSAGVDEVLFRDGYLSTVLAVRLSSGQPVVVKVRRQAERLEACWMVHCHLFERGFRCPKPLVAPFAGGGSRSCARIRRSTAIRSPPSLCRPVTTPIAYAR